ncbi:carbohydrate esterase family 16 protein [Karstenula rhodostoma CBS 690.94]|uniref:Carbohydrate esterase family 16 protein n=1 Tax=Karstenula rhodostoma CBS 690.94 TaxID=1392251 RepID=A0A9P4PIX2_9PLEO|nr:carbohydrate esterase family 16 protein [Karstenula rhodostoma CBS 690.94]
MKISALPVLFCLFPSSHALPARPRRTQYTRLIVFGDSFSDNGTGAWETSNHTWPSDPAYHAHSFTNGPVWPTLLAQRLNAPLLDFATGGATASNALVRGFTGANGSIPVPSASEQVDAFLGGDGPVGERDMLVHYVGANNVLFDTSVTGVQVATWIRADVQRLYAAGPRHVLLAHYPPVSTFPATYNDSTYAAIGPASTTGLEWGLANV